MDTQYKVIFVLGNPGSGKNTQCDLIKEKYSNKIHHFSCGDLLREEASNENSINGEMINKLIKEGKIVPATVTCSLAKREMQSKGKDKLFLIDGFPRNEENLEGWLNVFGNECKIEAVLHFDCSDEICTKRIKLRSQSSNRIDDNDDSLKKRFKVFQDETIPSIIRLSKMTDVIQISTEGTDKLEIFKEIVLKLEKHI